MPRSSVIGFMKTAMAKTRTGPGPQAIPRKDATSTHHRFFAILFSSLCGCVFVAPSQPRRQPRLLLADFQSRFGRWLAINHEDAETR
jgi:hypothetical protein